MTSKQQLEIPLSKKKILLMIAGSLGFVAIGIWFVIAPPVMDNQYWGNPAKLIIVGYVSIIFFGLCAFLLFRKLQDDRPGLIIDDIGLTDNSSATSAGQILWADIENISVLEMYRQKIIMFKVKNPQHYIDRETSSFKRKMMEMNYKNYDAPLTINAGALKISHDELFAILKDKLTKD